MTLALLAVLLLPALQDPQVDYREGLFEEIDQGNLDKAMERYAAILKSGAPDALKAKALLRTGFCHEKKGKKKEAEQAWRDVVERYPGAAETVKIARDRLASLNSTSGTAAASLEAQIQALVLDLTSERFELKNDAFGKLIAIGQPAVPELRKALQSRSVPLKSSAAYALAQIGSTEGVYDSLRSLWIDDGNLAGWALKAVDEVLKVSEEDRRKFLKDAKPEHLQKLVPQLAPTLAKVPDPAFHKVLEDWLVENLYPNTYLFTLWAGNRDVAEVRRFVKRLASAPEHPNEKVRELLKSRVPISKEEKVAGRFPESDPELKKALLEALTGESEPTRFQNSIVSFGKDGRRTFAPWLFAYLTPRELIRGPVHSWILKGNEGIRKGLLNSIYYSKESGDAIHRDLPEEIRAYQLDFITTAEHPMSFRREVYNQMTLPEKPDQQKKFLQFSVELFREQAEKAEGDADSGGTTVDWLMRYLPEDSKELMEIMDIAARRGWLSRDAMSSRQGIRSSGLKAAFRALKDPQMNGAKVSRLVSDNIQYVATPTEKLALAEHLPGFKKDWPYSEAVGIYFEAIEALPEGEREAAWTTYVSVFEASPSYIKGELAGRLIGQEGKHVDVLMSKAVNSPDGEVRFAGISHGVHSPTIPAADRLAILTKGLKDSSQDNQLTALEGLKLHPNLDAVPAIIDSLNSPFANVRGLARKALEEIKKHYEDQAEWKQWYDQTKKALNK